jgi:hypothetical protein
VKGLPALLLAVAGCVPDAGPGALDPVFEVVDGLPNVLHATWEAKSGRSRVRFGRDGALDASTPWAETPDVRVLGLVSGATYTMQAETDTGDEVLASETVEITIADVPPTAPRFQIEAGDPDAWVGDGYVMMALVSLEESAIAVLDRAGAYVWWMEARPGTPIPTAHLGADGRSVIYVDNDLMEGGWSGVGRVAFDGSSAEYRAIDDVHHDVVELPDGGLAWLAFESRESTPEEGGTAVFTTDAIWVADGFYGEARKVFSMLDDYGHDPWHVCSHSAVEAAQVGGEDFTHGNSLRYDADRELFLYMPKHLDAIVAVPREGGPPAWQAGGLYGDFVDEAGDTLDPDAPWLVDGPAATWWSHGHMSHAWRDGFVVYDNGSHHEPLRTRVAEYAWDPEARSLRRTFAFDAENGVYDPVLGDIRKLDNGNYLVSWTIAGMLTELTPDGEVVWRASTDLGTAIGRIGYLPSFYPDPGR